MSSECIVSGFRIHSDDGLTKRRSSNLLRWLIYLIDLVVDNLPKYIELIIIRIYVKFNIMATSNIRGDKLKSKKFRATNKARGTPNKQEASKAYTGLPF